MISNSKPTVFHNDTNEIPFYKISSEELEDYRRAGSDGRTSRNEDLKTKTDLLEEVKNIIERIDQIDKSNENGNESNQDDEDEDEEELRR